MTGSYFMFQNEISVRWSNLNPSARLCDIIVHIKCVILFEALLLRLRFRVNCHCKHWLFVLTCQLESDRAWKQGSAHAEI